MGSQLLQRYNRLEKKPLLEKIRQPSDEKSASVGWDKGRSNLFYKSK